MKGNPLPLRPHPLRHEVAVLIDPGDSWGRRVIHGISAAVRHQLDWDLLIAPRDDQWRFRIPADWRGVGVIAAIRDEKTAEHVHALQLPTINVSAWQNARFHWHRVNTDDRQRAVMAFQHFRERHFEHFAYYGPPSQRYSDLRGENFREVVQHAGYPCLMFQMQTNRRGWNSVKHQTLQWLQQTPRPLAVFAADPHPAMLLTEICHSADIHIPEELAVLAGDTDDFLCEVSDPPLSSVVLAAEQIGRESVALLHSILQGKMARESKILLPPLGVVQRQSTDILAVDDPLFVQALQLIRQQAHTGIRVGDILRAVPISRRLLEQRFRLYLNRSPADEIRRVKMDRVKELLRITDQTIEQIAFNTGFSSPSQLCAVFRTATDQTPKQYRLASRQGISLPG